MVSWIKPYNMLYYIIYEYAIYSKIKEMYKLKKLYNGHYGHDLITFIK